MTARLTKTVTRAITTIGEDTWTPIRYPNAIYDDDEQRWVSDAELAEVAEVAFTAFTRRRKHEHITARLIVRRVRRLNPKNVPAGQSEMFAVYRYHAVFTDSAEPMLAAEATHRDHAIIEQVIAELKNGPLAHLPSGSFAANSAWLVCAAISHNLIRAAGVLAGGPHTHARAATLRSQLITTPMPIAHSAHRQILHLPATGPGNPASTNCSAQPCTTAPDRSLTTRPQDHDRRPQRNSRTDRQTNHTQPPAQPNQDQLPAATSLAGGSRLKLGLAA